MTDPAKLRTCPDCGGILEPTRPEYLSRLDADAAVHEAQAARGDWQCFICGYHEVLTENDLIAEV